MKQGGAPTEAVAACAPVFANAQINAAHWKTFLVQPTMMVRSPP